MGGQTCCLDIDDVLRGTNSSLGRLCCRHVGPKLGPMQPCKHHDYAQDTDESHFTSLNDVRPISGRRTPARDLQDTAPAGPLHWRGIPPSCGRAEGGSGAEISANQTGPPAKVV